VYTKIDRAWTLYWRDRTSLPPIRPTANVEDLLAEINRDSTAIFWD
jgi:Protein of unknown function (DUF3024)